MRPFSSNIPLQQARITIKPIFRPLKRSYWYTSCCLNVLEDLNKDAGRSWVSQLSYNNWGEEMTLEIMDKGEQRLCAYALHKLWFYTVMGFKKTPYVTWMFPSISNESIKINEDADSGPGSKFPLFEPSHISFNFVMFMNVVCFLGWRTYLSKLRRQTKSFEHMFLFTVICLKFSNVMEPSHMFWLWMSWLFFFFFLQ